MYPSTCNDYFKSNCPQPSTNNSPTNYSKKLNYVTLEPTNLQASKEKAKKCNSMMPALPDRYKSTLQLSISRTIRKVIIR